MNNIKFSHEYLKLYRQISAELLKVIVCNVKDLLDIFVEYDTVYIIDHAIGMFSEEIRGHFELPKGKSLFLYSLEMI